jgi:hypothetical protein
VREKDWSTLLWSLQRRNCILLLGPELAAEGLPGTSQTLTGELARRLTRDLEPPMSEKADLPRVAQQYRAQIGRNDLEEEVVRFYAEHEDSPSEIHQAIAALPFYFIISSCHDSLLQRALERASKAPCAERYNYQGDKEDNVTMGTVDRPLIYHLYGAIQEPESLVLSENDLLDFLVAVVSKNPPLPNNIRSELQKRGRSFLFLGFGIRHWYLRILLHVLKFNQSDSRSFALEAFQAQNLSDLEQTILFYKTGYKIEVFDTEIETFVKELRERYQAAAPSPQPPLPGTGSRQARVFLSYADEDEALARRLCQELRESDLDPWMDKTGLGPGAEWDRTIEEKLEEADYVCVLQSHALARKSFSYVNKEINLALERQRYARQGVLYLIPLQIDDGPRLEDLKEFQTVSLRVDDVDAVRSLASTIKRDFQRRTRQ